MKYLIILLFSVSTALACKQSIPLNDISRALNPPVSGHYLKCEDFPQQECVCWDGIDFWTAELVYVSGKPVLRESSIKKAEYLLTLQNEKIEESKKIAEEIKIQAKLREIAIKEIAKE